MKESAKWSDFDEYLAAEMLEGREYVLTIASVAQEEFYARERGEKVTKPVLHFRETDKGLVLTRTNRRRLMRLFGNDQSACIGQKITLYTERISAFGQTIEVIRIKMNAVAPGAASEQEKS